VIYLRCDECGRASVVPE